MSENLETADLVYVIVHTTIAGRSNLRAAGQIYATWADADKAAAAMSRDFKVTAWIMGFPDPRPASGVVAPGLPDQRSCKRCGSGWDGICENSQR